uniref:Ig-like domain-containing protein n=1 Tax=Neogobius melanostomus TaxID=47308 RepID=A0A8C6UV40_9GOBI
MTTLTVTALLLCSISKWTLLGTCCCVWGLESSTVEVQSGQSATLLCSNYTSGVMTISWYRAVRRATLSRISVIFNSFEPAWYTDGLEDGRFNVTSNSSHIFLTISPVSSSDTGFYFCGYESPMGLTLKDSTYLDIHEGRDYLILSYSDHHRLLSSALAVAVDPRNHGDDLCAGVPDLQKEEDTDSFTFQNITLTGGFFALFPSRLSCVRTWAQSLQRALTRASVWTLWTTTKPTAASETQQEHKLNLL